jgi:hypothetical protein
VHPGVAVAVRDEHLAARRHRDVGDHVERPAGIANRRLADLEARVRRPFRVAERHQQLAAGGELSDRVVEIVGAVDVIVAVDEDAVCAREDPLAPRGEEAAVLVEYDDRVLAPVEDVDPVLRIHRDARDLDERPALGQLFPALQDLVLQAVRADRHGGSLRGC